MVVTNSGKLTKINSHTRPRTRGKSVVEKAAIGKSAPPKSVNDIKSTTTSRKYKIKQNQQQKNTSLQNNTEKKSKKNNIDMVLETFSD